MPFVGLLPHKIYTISEASVAFTTQVAWPVS
jgi:hypothetical protein